MSMMIQPHRFGPAGGDPHWANVVLLCHFDGTDGSTSFVDQTGKVMTAVGNAQIDTAQSKFGGASGLFDGAGDRITAADSVDWAFGTGPYTIEFFVRLNSKTSEQTFITQWGTGASANAWAFYIESGVLKMRAGIGFSYADLGAAWTPTLGVWYHLCVERDASGKTRIYRDGAMVTSHATSLNFSFVDSPTDLAIGAIGTTATFPSYDFNGWMDELRITKGVARYANDAGFTVPTTAYPNS